MQHAVTDDRGSWETDSYLSGLGAVTVKMMNHLDIDDLLQEVADQALVLTGANSAYISQVSDTGEYLEMVAAAGAFSNSIGLRHEPNVGLAGTAWSTGVLQFTEDYPSYSEMMPSHGDIRQACAFPLRVDNDVVGVLGIAYYDADSNLLKQLEVLQQFARLASFAIEKAILLADARAEVGRSEAITELSLAIHQSLSLQQLLEKACSSALEVFQASRANVLRLLPGNTLESAAAWECRDGIITPSASIDVVDAGQSIGRWCLDNCKVGFVARRVDEIRESRLVHDRRRHCNIGSTICVPLIHESVQWGVFYVERDEHVRNFRQSEINLMQIMGTQLSFAIHRNRLLKQIEHQAYHDSLTGLTNRFRFEQLLTMRTERASASDERFAVLFIDLDGFKTVNDTMGHAKGDTLLIEVARLFSAEIDDGDVLARIGGDEFAIIQSQPSTETAAQHLGERLLHTLATNMSVAHMDFCIGASIGYCLFPEHGNSVSALLRNSDIAMYQAKGQGRNHVLRFSASHFARHQQRIQTEKELRVAVEQGELTLLYQPQIASVTGQIETVEALVRWNHPKRGLVPPSEFIPLAEETGLISALGDWVLQEACRQLCQWKVSCAAPIRIAINISARQFAQKHFVSNVVKTAESCGVSPDRLELEVTESVVMHNVSQVIKQLQALRSAGFKIAIDDFGTGYSSLQYLQKLPLDVLKIDQSFVQDLDLPANRSLVKTMVFLARELDLQTVAEGVECLSQTEALIEMQCDLLQGYLYSKPVPAAEIPSLIREFSSRSDIHPVMKLKPEAGIAKNSIMM